MSRQQTPGPWVVRKSDTVYSQFNDRLIADCASRPHDQRPAAPRAQDNANAAFIVLACTHYAAWLDALERIRDGMADDHAYRECARQALAKAEGRTV